MSESVYFLSHFNESASSLILFFIYFCPDCGKEEIIQ